jgi:hypothetical protein
VKGGVAWRTCHQLLMDSTPQDFYFHRECPVSSYYKKSALNLFWTCLLFCWCKTSGGWTCNLLCYCPGSPQTCSCQIGVSSYADLDLAYFDWCQYGYTDNASHLWCCGYSLNGGFLALIWLCHNTMVAYLWLGYLQSHHFNFHGL